MILLFNVFILSENDKNGANQKNIEWLRMSIKSDLLKNHVEKKIHDFIFFWQKKIIKIKNHVFFSNFKNQFLF